MSNVVSHRMMIGGLIVLLHLPLILLVNSLFDELRPGQGITDLSPLVILALLAMTVLPYAALALFGIEWNPERSRLGEYDC